MSFSFDISGLNLDTRNLGFDWTMYCGNDVIQGLNTPINVPEPSSTGIYLLGLGLIGLGVTRRRKTGQG